MEFKSDAQKACYEKVAPWMKEIFGDFAMAGNDAPIFAVRMGSAFVQVGVWPWGDEDATITARSYVVMGPELAAELMDFLLRSNDRMRFGAFGIDTDGDIFFEHTIVGSTCDRDELKSSVLAVGHTADKYDDEIISKWGGQRAADRAQ